jgi:hypothetical protein
MMISLSDLIDFPSEGNSQGEILGFQVMYIQQSNFVHWQFRSKVKLVLQRNQMLIKADWCHVLNWWIFCGVQ